MINASSTQYLHQKPVQIVNILLNYFKIWTNPWLNFFLISWNEGPLRRNRRDYSVVGVGSGSCLPEKQMSRAPKPGSQVFSVLRCFKSKTSLQGDLNSCLVMTLSLCCDNEATWLRLWSQAGHLSCRQVGTVKQSFTPVIFSCLSNCKSSVVLRACRIAAVHTQKATAADLKSK